MQGKQPFYVSLFFIEYKAVTKVGGVFRFIYSNSEECSLTCFTDRLQNDSEENIQTIPTIGFNVEVLQYKNIKFQVTSACIKIT